MWGCGANTELASELFDILRWNLLKILLQPTILCVYEFKFNYCQTFHIPINCKVFRSKYLRQNLESFSDEPPQPKLSRLPVFSGFSCLFLAYYDNG